MLLCGLFFRLRLHGIPVVDGSLAYRRQAGAADPHLAGERHRDAMLLPVSYTHLDVYKRQGLNTACLKAK